MDSVYSTYKAAESGVSLTKNLQQTTDSLETAFWVILIFAVLVFVLWIVSLISIIDLNNKFNRFFDEYMRREYDKKSISEDDFAEETTRKVVNKPPLIRNFYTPQDKKRITILSVVSLVLLIASILVVLWATN